MAALLAVTLCLRPTQVLSGCQRHLRTPQPPCLPGPQSTPPGHPGAALPPGHLSPALGARPRGPAFESQLPLERPLSGLGQDPVQAANTSTRSTCHPTLARYLFCCVPGRRKQSCFSSLQPRPCHSQHPAPSSPSCRNIVFRPQLPVADCQLTCPLAPGTL